MLMKGAEAIVKAMEREGVEVIFGIPGGASIPLYDAIYDCDIRHILTRHEQVAAHAADGYARASGKIGVCSATSGPGATNLVTGIANAYLDSVPIVAITGQVGRPFIGKDSFQEADTIGITMYVTKHNFQLMNVEEIPTVFKEAFTIAGTGRPGPVLIDIPKDIQEMKGDFDFNGKVKIEGYRPTLKGNLKQIKKASELLVNAKRPMIFLGGGTILSGATDEVRKFARILGAPVVTSLMGKGAFPENDPLSLGVIGMHGRKAANYAISEADVIIGIGTRFSDRSLMGGVGNITCFAPNTKIIHVDIDPAEIGKNVKVEVPIVGDAKFVLNNLINVLKIKAQKDNEWIRKVKKYRKEFAPNMDYDNLPLKPQRVIKEIMSILSKDDIVTTEVGQCQMWAEHFLTRSKPRTFITSGGLGTMGFGFPAAIGAKVAKPENNVIDIAGDGSFLMTCQDLDTVVKEDIPVVIAILDNRFLGMVRQWQELFYNKRYSSVNLGKVNFVKLAESFNAKGIKVTKPGEIAPAVKDAFKSGETTVIDIIVGNEDNIFPMVPPGNCLKDMMEG